MFNFPPQARVGSILPKSKIYQHGRLSTALRERFVRQVEQITWQYKLAPETINLPERGGVAEIEVFDITLKTDALDEEVLRAIDRAIPLPIIFQLQHGQRIRTAAAYKRPSAAEAGQWVIDGYFASAWQPVDAEQQALPIAIDLHSLYEQLQRSRRNDYDKLEARLRKEIQFNRKVALNAELRELRAEIEQLGG
jgi:hypothetical protein